MNENEAETSVEADWDAEIDARVKDIEEDRVELVSADEVIERARAKLAFRRDEIKSFGRMHAE
jgi:hypothetical protein